MTGVYQQTILLFKQANSSNPLVCWLTLCTGTTLQTPPRRSKLAGPTTTGRRRSQPGRGPEEPHPEPIPAAPPHLGPVLGTGLAGRPHGLQYAHALRHHRAAATGTAAGSRERLTPPPAAPFQSAARWLREARKDSAQNADLGARKWPPSLAGPGSATRVGQPVLQCLRHLQPQRGCRLSLGDQVSLTLLSTAQVLRCPRVPLLELRPSPPGAEVISTSPCMDETLQCSVRPCRRHSSRGPNDLKQEEPRPRDKVLTSAPRRATTLQTPPRRSKLTGPTTTGRRRSQPGRGPQEPHPEPIPAAPPHLGPVLGTGLAGRPHGLQYAHALRHHRAAATGTAAGSRERLTPPPAAPFQSAARWLREARKDSARNADLGARKWLPSLGEAGLLSGGERACSRLRYGLLCGKAGLLSKGVGGGRTAP
ncbi:uncharacterized protein LOC136005339 [Lathamus discolor]|uniref:uncharacterized protein LOC136005339 n=1 Tax=Lathamus discolor TaxID=678569 RepID=UPI0032B7FB26